MAERTSQQFRERAEQLRDLAAQETTTTIREKLLELALEYDRLARTEARREARQRR